MKRSVRIFYPKVIGLAIAVIAVSVLVIAGGVSIAECPQSKIQLPNDDRQTSFTCEGLSANESSRWYITAEDVWRVSLLCNISKPSCDTQPPGINVSKPNTTTSVLNITNNSRKWLSVTCSSGESAANYSRCNITLTPGSTPQETTGATEATAGETSSSSAAIPVGDTTRGLQNEENDDGLLIAAIAGGSAAFVVIIIIIIVMVVVVRRKKRQKTASEAHADNDRLEEHVNPMYGSGDEPDTTSPSTSKPSGIALRIPTDTSNNDNNAATLEDADNAFDAGYSSMVFGEQQTASPSSVTSPDRETSQNTATQPGFATNTATPVVVTDADLYTAVGDFEQEQTSGPVQDHAGGYSTVGGPNSSATAAPNGDVYAVVQKSGPRAQSTSATTTVSPTYPGDSADGAYAFVDVSRSSAPASSASNATSDDPVSDNADNTYAVVDKSSSRGKGTGASNSPDTSTSTQQAQSGDVYAQVDKSSKLNVSTPENDDEGQSYVYAQVDKTSKENNSTPV